MALFFSDFLRKSENKLSTTLSKTLRERHDPLRLSGSGFAYHSDAVAYGHHSSSSQADIRNSLVVFVKGDRIEDFLEEHRKTLNAKVLILGNTDREWSEFNLNLPSSVRRVYLQNSLIPDDSRFRTLPIGIENLHHGKNGLPHLFNSRLVSKTKRRLLLVGPFGDTHPVRRQINETDYSNYEEITHFSRRMSSIEVAVRSAGYKFIAAPRGNGIDTHRFWETLYRGSIPVVESSVWVDNIESLGIPLLRTSGWSGDQLVSSIRGADSDFDPRAVPALWWDYWKKAIREVL
jgi:hypothetical protein